MDDDYLVELLFEACEAAGSALEDLDDWGPTERPGQYRLDLAADEAASSVLRRAGLSILSEESGRSEGTVPLLAVLDPIDGSTNAQRGVPFYSTSICVGDSGGPRVAAVVGHNPRRAYHAVRGAGAWRDGARIAPSDCRVLSEAIVAVGAHLKVDLGCWQYRMLGCASLELCFVADGALDAYLLSGGASLHPWDYAGGALICAEAGAPVAERFGRSLWDESAHPRSPVAASTTKLLEDLVAVVGREGQRA
ncbi:MAG: inositol monophosphatase family protein [Acidimicrobiales bacterium]